MNLLAGLSSLSNHYFAMRHGQSRANLDGIIVSTAENGVPQYGLSETGKEQVRQSIRQQTMPRRCIIVSSDFRRAIETAEIAHQYYHCQRDITISLSLRERYFGAFELQSNSNYQSVWARDRQDADQTDNQVESANAVMQRATELVIGLEKQYEKQTILLVSHGDTLQILQTAFQKLPASTHRQQNHLKTAEIRALTLTA